MKYQKMYVGALVVLLSCFVISGCTSEKEYIRDTSEGEVIQIDLAKMEQMLEDKETFVLVFGTHTCGYCVDFSIMLQTYLTKHNIKVYNIYLDEESATPNENRERINRHFKEFSTTPGIFYVKEGKNFAHLKNEQERISEDYFDAWVKEHQMDNKNK